MARIAAEGVVLAALAAKGVTPHDIKLALKYIKRLKQKEETLPEPLLQVETLLFPQKEELGITYFHSILNQLASLFSYVKKDPVLVSVAEFLRQYGQGRWQIDSSFLFV
jgi:hypothetical protein